MLSVNTKDIIEELKNLECLFDFSNLNENEELFSNKTKKLIGKYKTETPKNIWIDEFICLRSKACSFKCKDDIEKQIKLKGFPNSQSKLGKFKEGKEGLNEEKYQRKCNIYLLRSINREM